MTEVRLNVCFDTVLRSKVLKNQPDNDYYESMILTFTYERIINFERYLV